MKDRDEEEMKEYQRSVSEKFGKGTTTFSVNDDD